jgi:molybdopterin-guanine dinucleotide biosynthesis protein A
MQEFGDSLAGFVLAGGKSSRMGRDKALILLQGRPLIEIAVAAARTATSDVSIVGDRADLQQFAPVVSDTYRDCGPLGGMEAALRTSEKEWNLMLGVDTPFLPAPVLAYLCQRAAASNAQITVPRAGGYYQPLCAIYRKGVLAVVEQALKRGDYRLENLFQFCSLCVIGDEELAAIGIREGAFANLNTPADVETFCGREESAQKP